MESYTVNDLRDAVSDDFATAIDVWTREGIESLSPSHDLWWADNEQGFRQFAEVVTTSQNVDQLKALIRHLLKGCVHSVLATIDGASRSAEIGRVHLVGPDGSLGEGLHELFTDHVG